MRYYKATHSTGTVHLRATSRASGFSYAVAGPRHGVASWTSRPDLARQELSLSSRHTVGLEILEAVEITKKEHTAITRASKRRFSTTFMGKTYTTTVDISEKGLGAPGAIGYHTVGHVARAPFQRQWLDQARRNVEDLKAVPDRQVGGRLERAQARLAEYEADEARGYREVVVRDQVIVVWHPQTVECQTEATDGRAALMVCSPAFRFAKSLNVVEHTRQQTGAQQ